MKLAVATKDAPTVDPRASGGRQQVDSSSADSGGKGFDGILADVSSDVPGPVLDAGATLTPSVAAPTSGAAVLALTLPVSPGQRPAVGADKTPLASATAPTTNDTLVNALMDILGQVAGTKTTASATDSETKQPDTEGGSASQDDFGSVLKKLKTKDEPATADASVPNQPVATPSDLLAMIALGIAAPGQAASQTPAGSTPDGRAKLPTGAAAQVAGATPPVETAEMLVSDVAMSTHLAPVNPAQERSQSPIAGKSSGDDPHDATLPSSRGDVAQPEPSTAASAIPHASDDPKVTLSLDQAVTPVHGKSEPMPSATQLGVAFGPTRAIAAAITTVAAQSTAQAAANVPGDSPKAPLTVARTLTLQMNPAQLGTVDIKLHMTGQALDVQLTVSSQETLGIVSRERDTLAAALHDQTYQLNSLVIQDGGAAAASSGGNAASGGNNATQGNGFGSAGSDRQSGGGSDSRSGSGQSQSRQPPARQGGAPSPRASDSGSGPLFV